MNQIKVQPNKNEFLLYSFLIASGLYPSRIPLNRDPFSLRTETYDYFKSDKRLEMTLPHPSKAANFVFCYNDAPNYTLKEGFDPNNFNSMNKREYQYGSEYFELLIEFYKNSNFEEFYQRILPRYQRLVGKLEIDLNKTILKQTLEDAWEGVAKYDICVIPVPPMSDGNGMGLHFNGISYPVVGGSQNDSVIHLLGHECSHPIAKKVIEPIISEINKLDYLLDFASTTKNYSKDYDTIGICFEEHLIRAMQRGFIDPLLGICNVEQGLILEEKNGIIFIRDFYEEIAMHKKEKRVSLTETSLNILKKLKIKYPKN